MYHDKSSQMFDVRLAQGPADLRAVQALRYDVFVTEGGASGHMIDHDAGLERDAFDAHADHLLLCDKTQPAAQEVVGAYRLMTVAQAERAGGFYSASEFDLVPLMTSGRKVLELGRSCLRKPYRGGAGLLHLWRGLSGYANAHDIDVLFGVASLPGTDPVVHQNLLSYLFHAHAAPAELCPLSRDVSMRPLLMPDAIDRRAALSAMPALIKAYLRIGGVVGRGAFVDHAFNTIDVCLLLDAKRLSSRHRALFEAA